MNDNRKLIPVFSGTLVEVQKLGHDLQDAGIEVLIKDNDTMAVLSGFANISDPPMQIWILETEMQKAQAVIANFKERFKL